MVKQKSDNAQDTLYLKKTNWPFRIVTREEHSHPNQYRTAFWCSRRFIAKEYNMHIGAPRGTERLVASSETYNNKQEAIEGHKRWVKMPRSNLLKLVVEDLV